MKKRNVTRIRITDIRVPYSGPAKEDYFDSILLLRTARNEGDEENVNNYVLGILNQHQSVGNISFEKVKQ